MRHWLLLILLVALTSCSTAEPPRVEGIEVQPVWNQGAAVDDYPEALVLKVTLENKSSAIKLLRGRMRIGYGGRWVAMLTLEHKVTIPARTTATVELPMKLNIQRTAQTMQLRSALRQRRTEGVEIDWQVALRSRMVYVEQAEEAVALDRLAGENIEQIRDMLAEIFE
ncbi:MAG: hypothetical protein IIU59_02855 [Alistipes sp.]|nr:hypothetical protein [Alistipes sp.]